jgi:hypothetical protein
LYQCHIMRGRFMPVSHNEGKGGGSSKLLHDTIETFILMLWDLFKKTVITVMQCFITHVLISQSKMSPKNEGEGGVHFKWGRGSV